MYNLDDIVTRLTWVERYLVSDSDSILEWKRHTPTVIKAPIED